MSYFSTVQYVDAKSISHPDQITRNAISSWSAEEHGDFAGGHTETLPVMTRDAFRMLNYEDGSAETITIIPITNTASRVEAKHKMSVSGKELTRIRSAVAQRYERSDIHQELIKKLGISRGLVKCEIISLPKPRKAAAATTDGKTVTFYRVVAVNPDTGYKQMVQEGFVSQAAARAAAVEIMNSVEGKKYDLLHVTAYINRDTGSEALVAVSRPEPETAEITVKVTTDVPAPNSEIIGYFVHFWYHN